VITETDTALTHMLGDAAAAAAQAMPSGEPLAPAAPVRDPDVLHDSHQALLAPFTGARSGELLVVVDLQLAAALQDAPSGPIDLAAALAPTLAHIAAAMGPVTLGPAQVTEARLTVNRVLAAADSALVPLVDRAGRPRAAVAIALTPPAEPYRVDAPAPADRLDLLRGVEMDATAELGRARMTVNDLLALRAGAVVELDRLAGGPADLLVNGRLIARGEVVVVDENYGIRITQVVADPGGR
jgi:flagellar motor switch protein FliN/FliY